MSDLTALPSGGTATWRQAGAAVLAGAARLWPAARDLAAKIRAHRVTLAVPGLAGVALISASAGLKWGVWAGLGVAGLCCLRIDARL